MSKPEWVNQLRNAHDAETRPPMAWRVTWGCECECRDVDLGQFDNGAWFCCGVAGDKATEALARAFIEHAKAMLDDVDELINGEPQYHTTRAMDGARVMDWFIEARRAELNNEKT